MLEFLLPIRARRGFNKKSGGVEPVEELYKQSNLIPFDGHKNAEKGMRECALQIQHFPSLHRFG